MKKFCWSFFLSFLWFSCLFIQHKTLQQYLLSYTMLMPSNSFFLNSVVTSKLCGLSFEKTYIFCWVAAWQWSEAFVNLSHNENEVLAPFSSNPLCTAKKNNMKSLKKICPQHDSLLFFFYLIRYTRHKYGIWALVLKK